MTLLLLVRATYIWVLFFVHIQFVVNRTFNATPLERLQQHPLLFTMNCSDRMFFSWSLDLAQPLNPAYSTTFMRSESPSSKCAKLHTVAASSNRYHEAQSLYYCLFAPHIYAYCSSRISRCGEAHIQCNANGEIATVLGWGVTVNQQTLIKQHIWY